MRLEVTSRGKEAQRLFDVTYLVVQTNKYHALFVGRIFS